MVLYQIFNDGNLPKPPKDLDEPFPSPANADYELAEIIMKAISPKVTERWQDPMEMGQALINYMQRNAVNNTPLAPPRAILEDFEPLVAASEKEAEYSVPGQTEEIPDVSATVVPDESKDEEKVPESESMGDENSDESETPVVPVIEPEPAPEDDEDDEAFLKLISEESNNSFEDEEIPEDDLPVEEIVEEQKPRKIRWVLPVVLLLTLVLLAGGAYYLYQNYYLQTIDNLSIDGSQNQLFVTIETDMDLSRLNVRCTDTYGNYTVQPATNGQVVFSDLLPDSLYRIELETTGFHKLIGKTSEIFTTDALTNIVSVTAVTGSEDGSVILNFTVDGSDPEEWLLTYAADGEEALTQTFTGHSVTVKGLTVGKKYTFTFASTEGTEVLGNNTQEFTASRLVMAEDLTIIASENNTMTARWKQPDDVVIESWTARCYSDNGHEEIKEVTGNEVVFTNINSADSYTVEITAFGMTQPARVNITANPITITGFSVSEETPGQLNVSWEYTGHAPDGEWLLMYTLDNSDTPNVVKCTEESAVISPKIHGTTYRFEIQATDNTTIFANSYQHTCANAEIFDSYGLSAEKITAYLLKTPEGDWTYDTVGNDAFSESFTIGDSISVVLRAATDFYLPREDIEVLYVIRDAAGNVLGDLVVKETIDWNALWFDGDYHVGELDIPKVPTKAGNYSVSIYFNNAAVTSTTFAITE